MFILTITQVGAPDSKAVSSHDTVQGAVDSLVDFAGGSINIKTTVANGPVYYSGTIGGRAATDKVFQASHVWNIQPKGKA